MNPFIRFFLLYTTAVLATALIPLSSMPDLSLINTEYGNKLYWKVMKQIPTWEFSLSITITSFLFPYAVLWSGRLQEDSFGRLLIEKIDSLDFNNQIFMCAITTSFYVLPISYVFFIDYQEPIRMSGMYASMAIWVLHGGINSLYLHQLSCKLVLHDRK